MVNVPLLQKALDYITAHPKEWDQTEWFRRVVRDDGKTCGTTCCLAGTVALLEGWEPVWKTGFAYVHVPAPWTVSCTKDNFTSDARSVTIVTLELSDYQADRLFHQGNTLFDLWYYASSITAGEIVVPAQFAPAAVNI